MKTLDGGHPPLLDWWMSTKRWSRKDTEMAYCNCANKHRPGCPNDKPGGLPPLRIEDDKRKGNGKDGKRKGK